MIDDPLTTIWVVQNLEIPKRWGTTEKTLIMRIFASALCLCVTMQLSLRLLCRELLFSAERSSKSMREFILNRKLTQMILWPRKDFESEKSIGMSYWMQRSCWLSTGHKRLANEEFLNSNLHVILFSRQYKNDTLNEKSTHMSSIISNILNISCYREYSSLYIWYIALRIYHIALRIKFHIFGTKVRLYQFWVDNMGKISVIKKHPKFLLIY